MKKSIAVTNNPLVTGALVSGTLVFAALMFGVVSTASADLSEKVQKAFKGKILITDGEPVARSTDEATIAHFKKINLDTLEHASDDDDVYTWNIDFTAFLKSAPKVRALTFEFYTADKEKLFVADKRLMGIDPLLKIVRGGFSITEDDGVNRNRTYIIKLVGQVKKRDVTFAETRVTLK